MKILWYISPIDGPRPWVADGRYEVDHRRLVRLAQTIDQGGFYGALIGTYTHDTWSTSVSLIAATERMRFMIPHYAGAASPVTMAQRALTFDDYSRGRLILHIVNGQDLSASQQGVKLTHDERYELALEYWDVFRRLYRGEDVNHHGKYYTVDNFHPDPRISTSLPLGPIQEPHTTFWGGGDSPAGIANAGKLLEKHFTMLRPPGRLAEIVAAVDASAAANDRTISHGLLGSVIVRETEQEALAAFYSTFEETGAPAIAEHQAAILSHMFGIEGGVHALSSDDPRAQAKIDALKAGRLPTLEELKFGDHLYNGMTSWTSVDLRGIGIGNYIVGNPEQVAGKLKELQATLNFDTFILSAWPLIREAEYVADLLLPLLDLDDEPPVLAESYRQQSSALLA